MDFMVNCLEYVSLKDNLLLLKNKKHSPPPLVIAVVTAFLANLNWRLAVLMLIGAVLIVLVTFVNRKQAGEQGWESRFRLGEANSVTLE